MVVARREASLTMSRISGVVSPPEFGLRPDTEPGTRLVRERCTVTKVRANIDGAVETCSTRLPGESQTRAGEKTRAHCRDIQK